MIGPIFGINTVKKRIEEVMPGANGGNTNNDNSLYDVGPTYMTRNKTSGFDGISTIVMKSIKHVILKSL